MSWSCITVTLNNGVRTIKMHRPTKLNAVNNAMLRELIEVLQLDAFNDAVVLTIITSDGKYFTSGLDLSGSNDENSTKLSYKMLRTFIDYPKLIIAVVNGPAYGIGTTILAMCDVVYASDRSFFKVPYVNLGLTPVGCSSYNLPKILGRSKASEVMFLGETLTPDEALKYGIVSKVVPHEDLQAFVEDLHRFGRLPVDSVKNIKKLLMEPFKDRFYKIMDNEFLIFYQNFKLCGYVDAFGKKGKL